MNRESFSGSKCSKLEGEARKTRRECIAVGTEETAVNTAAETPEVQACQTEKETTAQTRTAVETAQAEPAAPERQSIAGRAAEAWKAFAGRVKGYFVFDTVVGKEKAKGTFQAKCASGMEKVKQCFRHERHRSAVALGGSVSLVAVAFVVVVLNFSIGFETVVNGQSVGVLPSKQECEAIVNEVNTTLVENFGEESQIDAEIVAIPCLVPRDSYTPQEEVKDAVCKLSDKMHEMQVIYLDDTALCALASEEEVQQVMQGFRDYYTGGDENVIFETDKELTVKAELAPISLLRSVEDAINVLNGSEKQENEYTVQPGDTLWSISRQYDTSVDELLAINEGLTEDIVDGDVITVKSYVPVVKVTTREVAEYTEEVPYETQVVETESLYRGDSEVTQEGENGEVAVVASIVKENGQEVSRDILEQTTVKEAVAKVTQVGTKEPPSGYGTGTFSAPVSGTITSRFGYRRSGYHKGLDIANSYGTPIRAADNGIVIAAGWDGLFGKLVKIDHQNGYVTYYAHNSSFAVSVGDVVQKGDVIAYMGSTGNSTGNHCHFEIHKNGVVQNPENYI